MICFSAASAQQLVDAFRPTGRCWCTAAPSGHGPAAQVPVTEDEPRTAYGEYGTGKAAIEALLHRGDGRGRGAERGAAPWASAVRAGQSSPLPATWTQTSGGGWPPANRSSCRTLNWASCTMSTGDVAQAFERALTRSAAIGSSFHVVSEQAMTMRGLAAGVAGWFGREPLADLVDWPEFERQVGAEHAGVTRDHAGRSIAASIDRGPRHPRVHRGTARWTPCTSRFAGSRPAATSTSVARTSRSQRRDDHSRHPLNRLRHATSKAERHFRRCASSVTCTTTSTAQGWTRRWPATSAYGHVSSVLPTCCRTTTHGRVPRETTVAILESKLPACDGPSRDLVVGSGPCRTRSPVKSCYNNDRIQLGNLGLRNAWFPDEVEWNLEPAGLRH